MICLALSTQYTASPKMSQLWLAITLIHIHQFKKMFLAPLVSRHSKISYRYNFLNYLAFTNLILFWSEITTSATWSSESSICGETFRRASSTRPLINRQHDCVHQGRRGASIFEHLLYTTGFFRATRPQKQALFQSHPQSTEENAFHFTCLACGSSRGSVGTQEYSSVKNFIYIQ